VKVTNPNVNVGSSSNSGEERLNRHEFQPRLIDLADEAAHRASNFNHETKPPAFCNPCNVTMVATRLSSLSATAKRCLNIGRFPHAFTHLIKHVQQQNSNSSFKSSSSESPINRQF
jgi:hypothetical protein